MFVVKTIWRQLNDERVSLLFSIPEDQLCHNFFQFYLLKKHNSKTGDSNITRRVCDKSISLISKGFLEDVLLLNWQLSLRSCSTFEEHFSSFLQIQNSISSLQRQLNESKSLIEDAQTYISKVINFNGSVPIIPADPMMYSSSPEVCLSGGGAIVIVDWKCIQAMATIYRVRAMEANESGHANYSSIQSSYSMVSYMWIKTRCAFLRFSNLALVTTQGRGVVCLEKPVPHPSLIFEWCFWILNWPWLIVWSELGVELTYGSLAFHPGRVSGVRIHSLLRKSECFLALRAGWTLWKVYPSDAPLNFLKRTYSYFEDEHYVEIGVKIKIV